MKQEFTAKTIEEAKAMAAAAFGAEQDKIKFEVLEEPKKGLFGKVKGDAKIKAEYDMTKSEIAVCYIKKILDCMEIENTLDVTEIEDGAVIDILGDTTGAIIGRRGETLDALQYLASMAANKGNKSYYRISLDSCGYREKRKTILEELATKISKTVIRTGRTSTLEPMNPYERRIIHSTVAAIDGVSSKSIGDEPFRKIIITLAGGQRFNRSSTPLSRPAGGNTERGRDFKSAGNNQSTGGDNKGGYRRDNRDTRDNRDKRGRDELPVKAVEIGKSSFEKEYKRPKPEDDVIKGGLYDKIDV
ncbi:MAG: Jag N-terminal domain-containing protein [Oscillospiraceae bacterium]|nr:Jag N-terminal domain-containing protein [Oscillospiraceae bacterium]